MLVQFGNNCIQINSSESQIGLGCGLVQVWLCSDIFHRIISKLDSMLSYYIYKLPARLVLSIVEAELSFKMRAEHYRLEILLWIKQSEACRSSYSVECFKVLDHATTDKRSVTYSLGATFF